MSRANIHPALRAEYEAQGWVVVRPCAEGAPRLDIAHPDRTCLRVMRGGRCELDKGHRSRCSTVVFFCDICHRARRGQPFRTEQAPDEQFAYCFPCVRDAERNWP